MSRDTFTLVLNFWITLQLVWVTMLCAVQLVQISRNQTTYENMRGNSIDRSYPSSQAFASAMTAGTTSLDAAGLSASGQGPNPALAHPHPPGGDTAVSNSGHLCWGSILSLRRRGILLETGCARDVGRHGRRILSRVACWVTAATSGATRPLFSGNASLGLACSEARW